MEASMYDSDYYERGLETGKSFYQNYRWIPELTLPLAMTIIDFLGIERGRTILDFGCAKGFLVKAFRLLYREAYGVDISKYAIENCDSFSKPYCFINSGHYWMKHRKEEKTRFPEHFDFCIAKDVFEHIKKENIEKELNRIESSVLFIVVPFGDGKRYIAEVNNLDKTHVTCQSMKWWNDLFVSSKIWKLIDFRFQVPGIKDAYYEKYPEGHGFFVLEKM